jgi:hypothetical protein
MKAHAYNAEAFEKLLGICTKHGASYNPGNAAIERTALQALLEEAQKSIHAVHKAESDLVKAVNLRQSAYDGLSLLGTSIVNIAEAGGMPPAHLKDLNRITKKFRSQPFNGTAQKEGPGGQAGQSGVSEPSPETPVRFNRILGFGSKLQTLAEVIQFLEGEATYNPKEPQFTIEGLKDKVEELHAHNAKVNQAKTALKLAKAFQHESIFNKMSGLCGIGRRVKRYLRGVFKLNSAQYKEVQTIKFKSR